MRRNGLILLASLVLVWAVLAVVLDSASLTLLSGSRATRTALGVSPACLPRSIEGSAALAGAGVEVSPEPESDVANPDTQISVLGAPAAEVHVLSVTGSRSGPHTGALRGYSQGDGASFLPARSFDAGEQVTVHATIGTAGAGRAVVFRFRVDTPYPTAGVGEFPNPAAAPGEYQRFATAPAVRAPVMSVTVADRDPAAGDILTTNGPGPGQYGPLIYTPQGRLVWADPLGGGEAAEDLDEQTYEGQRDLTWWRGKVLSLGYGDGEDIVMNSHYQTVARLRGANGLRADLHDFQIAPDDVAYITAFNPIRCDLAPLKGARGGAILDTAIQEVDIKTGLVRWEWHSLDHVAASESETPAPTDTTPWDWFHINSIDPEPDGDVLISARNTWAAYQLQGSSGRVLWRLGGLKSSFRMGPGTQTAWQHDARMLPDGEVTLFDDGDNPPIHQQSRGLRLGLDFTTHEATVRADYTHPPPLLAASQGNMQTLSDGSAVVDYGGIPEITEYSRDGTVLLDAHLPYAMSSYRGFRVPWSGRPLSPPAMLASLNNTSEETIVDASWNGATEVAAWRVLAGKQRGRLAPQETFPASGFESTTILPRKFAYVAVQALDSSGRVLGTSRTGRVVAYAAALTAARTAG